MAAKHATSRASRKRQIDTALADVQERIVSGYPHARFRVTRGDDPPGVYLAVSGTGEDLDAVMDSYIDRLIWYQDEQHLLIYVLFETIAEHDLLECGATDRVRAEGEATAFVQRDR